MKYDADKVLRGTVFLGAPGTGKTFLMQHRALAELRRQEEARLVFVGIRSATDPILALAPGAHVAREEGGRFVIEGDHMTAYFCDADIRRDEAAAAEGRRLVLETLRAARSPEGRNKYILAVDEVFAFFRTEGERDELFVLLDALLDSPVPSITFLITFQTVGQIMSGFGMVGVELLSRLHEKFIFKSFDARECAEFAGCAIANPIALQRAEAIHIYHGMSELVDIGLRRDGAVIVKEHELKPLGFWRKREIRGESMAEPLAAALTVGLLVLAALAAVKLFIQFQTTWAASPRGQAAGILFYVITLAMAAASTKAYGPMRACLAAVIAASFSIRHAKRITDQEN